jgi:hypothetical protein
MEQGRELTVADVVPIGRDTWADAAAAGRR